MEIGVLDLDILHREPYLMMFQIRGPEALIAEASHW